MPSVFTLLVSVYAFILESRPASCRGVCPCNFLLEPSLGTLSGMIPEVFVRMFAFPAGIAWEGRCFDDDHEDAFDDDVLSCASC